jgi:hypothetical protein
MQDQLLKLQQEQLELKQQLLDRKELLAKLDRELFDLEQKNFIDSDLVKELQDLEKEYMARLQERDDLLGA